MITADAAVAQDYSSKYSHLLADGKVFRRAARHRVGRHPGSVEKVHSLARSHVAQRRQRKTLAEHLATGARLLKTVAGHGGGMRSRESVLTGGAGGRDRRR